MSGDDHFIKPDNNATVCQSCGGSGEIYRGVGGPDDPERCHLCNGTGEATRPCREEDVEVSFIPCIKCQGEGRIFKSKYGGNDPDVWDAGRCEACDGSGNHTCDARGCTEIAQGFNDDGEALCEDCLMEWMTNYAED